MELGETLWRSERIACRREELIVEEDGVIAEEIAERQWVAAQTRAA